MKCILSLLLRYQLWGTMYYLFFLFTCISCCLFSAIKDIASLSEAHDTLSTLSSNSLVVFDIDEVLTTFQDTVLTPAGREIARPYFKEMSDEHIGILLTQARRRLLEKEAPEIIHQLQKKNIKTMALTSCRTGAVGSIVSIEEERFQELLSFQINFLRSFPETSDHSFLEIATDKNHPPVFKKGILFSGGDVHDAFKSKGKVLMAFLDWLRWRPEQVVFFDDNLYNTQTIEEELRKNQIPVVCFHYERCRKSYVDNKIAELQFRTLFQHKKWLSDQEARREETST